jgi:Gluconate 2-dehydrogenase subunit 3
MDRRTTIKWMLAVAGATQGIHDAARALGTAPDAGGDVATAGRGYGTDPKLTQTYKPGDLWPLTFTSQQRSTAKVLCDLIIPADASSPSASDVGVVDFLDEWISAPYKRQRGDRTVVLEGLAWLDREAAGRHGAGKSFVTLSQAQQTAICDDICFVDKAQRRFAEAAKFFARYRDLTAGGFYTTPQGRKDVRYVGNVPLPRFDGPPLEVLKKVGLA